MSIQKQNYFRGQAFGFNSTEFLFTSEVWISPSGSEVEDEKVRGTQQTCPDKKGPRTQRVNVPGSHKHLTTSTVCPFTTKSAEPAHHTKARSFPATCDC